jgi:hypothetical protein
LKKKKEKKGESAACLKYSVPIFVESVHKMQRLEVSSAVRPIYGSLGIKGLKDGEIYKNMRDFKLQPQGRCPEERSSHL